MKPTTNQTEPANQSTLLIDVREVALQLGLSERSVWRFARTAKMPLPMKLGKARRWRAEEVRAWINEGCPQGLRIDFALEIRTVRL
jgi:predicted DNA-binding transcriptional regulator AlpA